MPKAKRKDENECFNKYKTIQNEKKENVVLECSFTLNSLKLICSLFLTQFTKQLFLALQLQNY